MTEPAPPEAPPRAQSDPAVERYTRRMRPRRIAYAAAIVVAALVLLVIVKIAYSVGEISHTTLRTAAQVPPSIALGSPSAALSQAWRTSDATAIGTPNDRGTIVTYDEHSVRGRDARTGKITWSYTRTDRTVCTAAQTTSVTVAVYELHGNCDELTGLDSGTGRRQWTRTLDKDSNQIDHAVDGHPHYAVGPYTVMIWTPKVIYAIDPSGNQDRGGKSGGLDRWVFAEPGCTIEDAVLGSAGALISQTCAGRNCTDLKFCGNGTQLLLRDSTKGEENDSSKNKGNPDQILWNRIGSNLRPASADRYVTAVAPDGTTLLVLSTAKGAVQERLPLSGGTGAVTARATNDGDLIRFGGITYALGADSTAFAWQAETGALPTVTSNTGAALPDLPFARLTVPTTTGIAVLSPTDGTVSRTFSVSPPAAGSAVHPFGTGFLVTGPQTVLYR
jgi:hypothetical protein